METYQALCPDCGGEGEGFIDCSNGGESHYTRQVVCEECHGSGEVSPEKSVALIFAEFGWSQAWEELWMHVGELHAEACELAAERAVA